MASRGAVDDQLNAMATTPLLDDDELQKLYLWVDQIPLTRPKRNIARDFSDGGEYCRFAGCPRTQRAAGASRRRHSR